MCGIAGILSFESTGVRVDRAELAAVRDAMRKRGPDGEGLWLSAAGELGLAHRRLAIVDLSETGSQPMVSANGRLAITFNGEIYNYAALREALIAQGRSFRSTSDTEVLLHLYEEEGPRMLSRLRGMYAMAIWDEERKELFLARDPMGIKPLYFVDDSRRFAFASQVKALLRSAVADTSPNAAGHVGFFLWGYVPDPHTLYRGIRALEAGRYMVVDRHGRRREHCFFDLRAEIASGLQAAAQRRETRADATEKLEEALRDSVRHHLVADVPVGLFLSAGIDSGALAAIAARERKGGIGAITLGFAEFVGTEHDEVPLAQSVAARHKIRHSASWISKGDFDTELANLFEAMDQPSIDGANTYFVSKAASQAGMKVAISGLGGDELFAGYPTFSNLPRMISLFRLGRAMPELGRRLRAVTAPIAGRISSPKYAGLVEYGGTYAGAYLLHRGLFMPWELEELVGPEMARDGWNALQPLARLQQTVAGLTSPRWIVTALETSWYMRCQLLRDADWAGMAHSLEIRVPFADVVLLRRMVELAGSSAWPSKRALAASGHLPPDHAVRRKTGFSVPIRRWMLASNLVHPRDRGLRGWARRVRAGFVNRKRVLISTMPPLQGGVTTMTEQVARCLKEEGHEVAIAYAPPYSVAPGISVPLWRLPFDRPRARTRVSFDGVTAYEIGTRLPEFEFARCLPSGYWKSLVKQFDCHVAVSGSIHAALPIVLQNKPCLAWVATPYMPDKVDRRKHYPWFRKLADVLVDTPLCCMLEKKGLRFSNILALSEYTAQALRELVPDSVVTRMPMPIDVSLFSPRAEDVVVGRVGFSGRISDARKNVRLLLEAVNVCLSRGHDVTVELVGGEPTPEIRDYIERHGLAKSVRFLGSRKRQELEAFYRSLDVFAIPSFQEGLGIVGLEAMACGCPIVSTRCGGASDYVRDGVNGFLVGFSAQEMADAITRIIGDRALRDRMSRKSVQIIRDEYSVDRMRAVFITAFRRTFGGAEATR